MSVKLLTEHYLELLSLTEAAQACPSLHVKMPHCWKSHVTAQLSLDKMNQRFIICLNQFLEADRKAGCKILNLRNIPENILGPEVHLVGRS